MQKPILAQAIGIHLEVFFKELDCDDRSKSRSQSRGLSSSHQVNDTELQDPDVTDVADSSNHVDDSTSNSIMTVHLIENVPPITYKVEINRLSIKMELD